MKENIENKKDTGIVFNIQHYSIHDGPGIRTNVFLKGCPLRCKWCANPESNTTEKQLMFLKEACTGCQRCVEVCPVQAISLNAEGKTMTDRTKCQNCGKCAEICPSKAREMAGNRMTVEEVYEDAAQDELFYGTSGGGVTLTGGEVFLQPDFAAAVLKKCRENGIHTAIETCGFAAWESIEKLVPYLDLALYDIKHMDSGKHREGTGVPNETILKNLVRLSEECHIPVIVRTPVIPGFNDTLENMNAMGVFISQKLPTCLEVNLLPYHNLGDGKRMQLEAENPVYDSYVPTEEQMEKLRNEIRKYGLVVK